MGPCCKDVMLFSRNDVVQKHSPSDYIVSWTFDNNTPQHIATFCNTLQYTAIHCNCNLCGSVLQRGAVIRVITHEVFNIDNKTLQHV